MMKIHIINGPNLNLIELRDPIYGQKTLASIQKDLEIKFQQQILKKEIDISWFQSNHEGDLIDYLQAVGDSSDLIIINPGGFSHTSVALRDALEIVRTPKIEVHITNTYKRESFRHNMLTAGAVDFIMNGFGNQVYYLAILTYMQSLKEEIKDV